MRTGRDKRFHHGIHGDSEKRKGKSWEMVARTIEIGTGIAVGLEL